MKKLFTLFALLALFTANIRAITWVTVDPSVAVSDENSLIFKTIQEAISLVVATGLEEPVPIFIKNGTYNESLIIGNKTTTPSFNLSLIGESRDGVIVNSVRVVGAHDVYPIIQADSLWIDRNYAAALYVNGKGDGTSRFYAENITFRNFASAAHTAANVIYFRDIDGFTFKNCDFLGVKSIAEYKKQRRSMFYNCNFEGESVITKLGGTSMLYKCNFKLTADNGYIAEPEDNLFGEKYGSDTVLVSYIFRDGTLTKGDTVHAGTCYLGYPNSHHSAALFHNMKMDMHIAPVGWKLNGTGYNNTWSYLAECTSMNLDGSAADISARGNGGLQLTAVEVDSFFYLNKVYQMNNIIQGSGYKYPLATNTYHPDSMIGVPAAPTNVALSGTALTWNAVTDAASYVVYKDGAFDGFAETNSYVGVAGATYTVRASNSYGGLSAVSGSAQNDITPVELYNLLFVRGGGLAVPFVKEGSFSYTFANGLFQTTENCNFTVYNLSGRNLKTMKNVREISLNGLAQGLYLIKSVDANKNTTVTKVVL
jgi:pectinesterase